MYRSYALHEAPSATEQPKSGAAPFDRETMGVKGLDVKQIGANANTQSFQLQEFP